MTASSNRFPTAVTSADRHWPPNRSGIAGGARTNTATSNTPTLEGHARSGRLRTTFATTHAPSRIPKPAATATTSSQIGKSRLGALATSTR
jgi:hypothetical protein